MTAVGLPHSGISGSRPARGSPERIVVRHALLRLLAPRHPPVAHCSLTSLLGDCSSSKALLTHLRSAVFKVAPLPRFLAREPVEPRWSKAEPIRQTTACLPDQPPTSPLNLPQGRESLTTEQRMIRSPVQLRPARGK